MIIVDNQIKNLVESNNLITNFNEENLSSISYDVTIDEFVDNEEKKDYILDSLNFIYIKTKESLNMGSSDSLFDLQKYHILSTINI